MNIPSVSVSGKVSWFGGPNDPSSGPTTASGASVKEPGIAIYNKATLGGYWKVTAPNGRSAVLRQTDLGPAPWTGRAVDVTYSALGQLGYNEHNFPTNSVVKATYLGDTKPPTAAQEARQATQGIRTSAIFNRTGYEAAAQHAAGERAAASLFTEPGSGAIREALDKAGTIPAVASFLTSATPSSTTPSATMSSATSTDGSKVLSAATKQLGIPYKWGGDGGKEGFDCSGLTQFAYKQAGISIPRTAEEQYKASDITNTAAPGSLIFFSNGKEISHVEMVAGNGKMIGADHTGTNVRYEDLPTVGSKWGSDTVVGIGVPK